MLAHKQSALTNQRSINLKNKAKNYELPKTPF